MVSILFVDTFAPRMMKNARQPLKYFLFQRNNLESPKVLIFRKSPEAAINCIRLPPPTAGDERRTYDFAKLRPQYGSRIPSFVDGLINHFWKSRVRQYEYTVIFPRGA